MTESRPSIADKRRAFRQLHEAGRDDDIVAFQCSAQRGDLCHGSVLIATQRQRPDARVDKQGHFRDRSTL